MGTRAELDSLHREYASICASIESLNKKMEKLGEVLLDLGAVYGNYEILKEDMKTAYKSYNKGDYLWFGTLYDDLLTDYDQPISKCMSALYDLREAIQDKRDAYSEEIADLEIEKAGKKTRIDNFVITEPKKEPIQQIGNVGLHFIKGV